MITIKKGCSSILPCQLPYLESITYNGYEYISLCQHGMNAFILNEKFCPVAERRIPQCYSSLSFSIVENGYYAVTPRNPFVIFKLNQNFEEVGCINIPNLNGSDVYAISAHPSKPEILLLCEDEIKYLDVIHEVIIESVCLDRSDKIMDMIALDDGYILSYHLDEYDIIQVTCTSCEAKRALKIPFKYRLQAMTLNNVCSSEDESCMVYDVQLILMNCETQELLSTLLEITCENKLPIPPQPCDCPSEHECGKNEVIHSIALEEAGIAHILNAEGEKIQKAVASETTIEELLRINDSVSRTITKITLLEGQLYVKLESLRCLCDEDIENKQ